MVTQTDNETSAENKASDFLDRASLGLSGVSMLIIVGMLTVTIPLDFFLTWAIRFAAVALPIFFAIYLAKDEVTRLLRMENPKAAERVKLVGYLGIAGLFLLGAAIVSIVAHFSAGLALGVTFLLLLSGELGRWLRKTKI